MQWNIFNILQVSVHIPQLNWICPKALQLKNVQKLAFSRQMWALTKLQENKMVSFWKVNNIFLIEAIMEMKRQLSFLSCGRVDITSQAKLVRSGLQLTKKQPLQPLVSSGTPLECMLSPISPWDSTRSRALYTLSFPALFPTWPDSLSFFYVLVFPVLIRWAQAHVLNWSYSLTSKLLSWTDTDDDTSIWETEAREEQIQVYWGL